MGERVARDGPPEGWDANDWERFEQAVWRIVAAIPTGNVTSYGAIAAALGEPRKAREVGWVMFRLPEGHALPAHRVVNREGRLSGAWAFSSADEMERRLRAEGVQFLEDGRVDMKKH